MLTPLPPQHLIATSPLAAEMNRKKGGVIQWDTLMDLLGGSAKAGEVKAVITRIKNEVTEHLPVLTRFGRYGQCKTRRSQNRRAQVKPTLSPRSLQRSFYDHREPYTTSIEKTITFTTRSLIEKWHASPA